MSALPVIRSDVRLLPDPARVIVKPFVPGEYTEAEGEPAARAVVDRVLALPNDDVEIALRSVRARFSHRQADLDGLFEAGFGRVAGMLSDPDGLTRARRLLVGSCFVHEYSVEAAALTNPSIVPSPDQSGLEPGQLRFVMSLRAIGEGHRSSIEFRSGIVGADGRVRLDDPGRDLDTGTDEGDGGVSFAPGSDISERVLYPRRADERQGLEDARFVRFVNEDGTVRYLATYTAFDGAHIRSRLLETRDFVDFRFRDLVGEAARDKGMALFPRRIGGRFAALSRHDDESNHIAYSEDLRTWDSPMRMQVPKRGWELIKLGNAGSPLETEAGWLVVTHAVGPFREYVLGAILLDRDDPSRVMGTLDEPVLVAADDERDGYVPNVVYSCGSLVHEGRLVLPYGFADRGVGVATIGLQTLLERLR